MITRTKKAAAIIAFILVTGALTVYTLYRSSPIIVCRLYPRADIRALATSLEYYKKLNGTFPSTEQGLEVLVPRIMEDVPIDPWGTRYVYRFPGKRYPNGYDLFSAGPDRIAETADDDWGK